MLVLCPHIPPLWAKGGHLPLSTPAPQPSFQSHQHTPPLLLQDLCTCSTGLKHSPPT